MTTTLKHRMRKLSAIVLACLLTTISTSAIAQRYSYNDSRYMRTVSRHDVPVYLGFRIGPAFAFVNSDDPMLNGGSMKTGLSFGGVVGLQLTNSAPLYFETGLTFVQKGGRGYIEMEDEKRAKFTFNLAYLELPLVVKYSLELDEHMSFQPFLGGYFAFGIGGKIRNFKDREAYGSFSGGNNTFRAFDGGLRFGCGFSYDLAYIELGYDLGIANIGQDDFDTTHNGCLFINLGVNF